MNVIVRTIPHAEQRYDTCGDWWFDADTLHVRVSAMGDKRHEALVTIHETIEALLCRAHGVTAEEVDRFDFAFTGDGEPGDDPLAPYWLEHVTATEIERRLASELGVDWDEYERLINQL